MVFKRREKRSILRTLAEFVYPKGGWARAFHYVRHRVRRLPDTPERIARGIFAGVFTSFTPFYGLHFVIAAVIARIMNGNIVAAIAGTFFGNPLTYIPIGVVALKTGHFLLGSRFDEHVEESLVDKFVGAGWDLLHNFIALFTSTDANWSNLIRFYHEVFLPYLVGGIIPGIVSALVCYYLSVPVIAAYQKHRRGRIKKKLAELRAKAAAGKKADRGA
ncbi:MAG: DUF2062 domain-containing protein [Paracoccaceae bacterium]